MNAYRRSNIRHFKCITGTVKLMRHRSSRNGKVCVILLVVPISVFHLRQKTQHARTLGSVQSYRCIALAWWVWVRQSKVGARVGGQMCCTVQISLCFSLLCVQTWKAGQNFSWASQVKRYSSACRSVQFGMPVSAARKMCGSSSSPIYIFKTRKRKTVSKQQLNS